MDADVPRTCSHGSSLSFFREGTGCVGYMQKGESSFLNPEHIDSPLGITEA